MTGSIRITAALAVLILHASTMGVANARGPEDVEQIEHESVERNEAPERAETPERAERPEAGDIAETVETVAERIDLLARDERPDRDEAGFPVRRGEISAVDLGEATIATLAQQGFSVLRRTRFAALGHDIVTLAPPRGMPLPMARARIVAADPGASVDMVHYYGLTLSAGSRPRRVRPGQAGTASGPAGGAARIGMIDTAVASHPALGASRIVDWAQGRWIGAPVGHGTAVASILAQGGAPTIFVANIFRGNTARPFTSAEVVADALEWMVEQGAPVINMSLAGPRDAVLDKLVASAQARGVMIVAAAGNGGPAAPPAYPAALPGVVAVTAVDKDLHVYRYANRGRYVTVAASGVDVIAANATGGMARFSGTSFATPRIAAWLARCRVAGGDASRCRDTLQHAARDLGQPGRDDTYGFGYVE